MEKKFKIEPFYDKSQLDLKDKDKIEKLASWWGIFVKYQFPREVIDLILELPMTAEVKEKLFNYRLETSKKDLYKI